MASSIGCTLHNLFVTILPILWRGVSPLAILLIPKTTVLCSVIFVGVLKMSPLNLVESLNKSDSDHFMSSSSLFASSTAAFHMADLFCLLTFLFQLLTVM